MAFKILLKKFKGLKVKRVGAKEIKNKVETQRIWTGVSHGCHAVERGGIGDDGCVHAQREQVEDLELWLFGVCDDQMSSGIAKHLQSHLFDNNLSEYEIRRKAKEIVKKAYLLTKAKIQDEQRADYIKGSANAIVMNGDRFVAASVGGYRAVLCRDGEAKQLGMKHQRRTMRKWSVSDIWKMKCASSDGEDSPERRLRLSVSAQKVHDDTEFIILASDGVWEVMRNQEAADLIAHIDDAQKAAEHLAEEALNRMSKSTISCIVIRFQ